MTGAFFGKRRMVNGKRATENRKCSGGAAN